MTLDELIANITKIANPVEQARLIATQFDIEHWLSYFYKLTPAQRKFALQALRALYPELAQLVEGFLGESEETQEPKHVTVEVLEVKSR